MIDVSDNRPFNTYLNPAYDTFVITDLTSTYPEAYIEIYSRDGKQLSASDYRFGDSIDISRFSLSSPTVLFVKIYDIKSREELGYQKVVVR